MSAISLQRLGHNITVLERSPEGDIQSQGAGIVAGGPTQEFFEKHDRTKTPIGITSRARQYLNHEGDVIDFERRDQHMTGWDLLYSILRANFDGRTNTRYCPIPSGEPGDGKGKVLHEHVVNGILEKGKRVKVTFTGEEKTTGSLDCDVVIAADGPSSTIRKIFQPEVERKYCGYVAWRGTVKEKDLSEETRNSLSEKFTFFHAPHIQMLTYPIPGASGTLKHGERLMNYVWYVNYPEGPSRKEVMTGASGELHHFTNSDVDPVKFDAQRMYAAEILPPQFAELIAKTPKPFVQAITDVKSINHVFWNGKVIMVGDAVCGLRPHTAASTSQAAMHALLLSEVEDFGSGRMSLKHWENRTREWAESTSKSGMEMGDTSQFGRHPLAVSEA